MDQFISWLDTSGLFTTVSHAWPWVTATASLALIASIGIANVARRYGRNETSARLHHTAD